MFHDEVIEVRGRICCCAFNAGLDEYDEASIATSWAVSILTCVFAKVWDRCAGSELGFLYTGDKDVCSVRISYNSWREF